MSSALETQLKASVIWEDLRAQESATLAAIIKAAQQELQNRKAKLRSDVAELAKQRKALQRQAAELSSAGYRVRARVARKDKGTKRGPKPVMRVVARDPYYFCDFEDCDTTVSKPGELCAAHVAYNAAIDAEREDEQRRDDWERQNAPRGNEP